MRTVALVGRGRWGTNHLNVLQRLRAKAHSIGSWSATWIPTNFSI